MALPRSVRLCITYDGSIQETGTADGAASGTGSSCTVVSGDTLWGIAKRYLGSGMRYTEIYNANAEVIEAAAKAHGKKSSENGRWIWAGEVLTIPGGQSAQTGTNVRRVGSSNPALGSLIGETATAFTYTDIADGQSDSISVTMHDINKEWIGSRKPKKGAALGAKIAISDNGAERTFDCGSFILDDISFSGRPLSCTLGAVSVPADDDFKSLPKTVTWEKTTVKDIASKIAQSAGVKLVYDAPSVRIDETEQNGETDSAFLYSLCGKYGLGMKVYNHKIVIFDIAEYEEKGEAAVITETDVLSWSINETIDGTYTGVKLNYTNPDIDDTISVTIGTGGRMYAMNVQADSRHDAELQAAAKVNAANRKIQTMSVTVMGNPDIVATQCVRISGFGAYDGKYYADSVKHSVGNSGYRTQITMHRVQQAVRVTAPAETAASGGRTYTTVSGDTLWGISKKFYGSGAKYVTVYEANRDVIEAAAKAHGKKSSDNGHWIWAGEVLTIP